MPFFGRDFAGALDIQLVVDWVRTLRPSERVTDYPSVFDLPQLLLPPQNQETMHLWFSDTGELVAFAFVDAFHTLRFEIDWQRSTHALESEIARWGNDNLNKRMPDTCLLHATAHEDDMLRLRYLERQGFARLPDQVMHLECPLSTPITIEQPPVGYHIRPIEGEHEASAIAALHREAFGTPHMTTERRLAIMRTAHYDSALDLVAITLDGRLVAYAAGTLSPEENKLTGRNACYTDLFATHPDHRGRGLARALLSHLLHLLQDRGLSTAKLNTSSENGPMLHVATSTGFQVVSRTLRFARPVSSSKPHSSSSTSAVEPLPST